MHLSRSCGTKGRASSSFASSGQGGSLHWLALRGELFRGQAGSPERAIGVALEITERRQAAELRERLLAELRAANSGKDELLGMVSHELGPRLTILLGAAEVLRRAKSSSGGFVMRHFATSTEKRSVSNGSWRTCSPVPGRVSWAS